MGLPSGFGPNTSSRERPYRVLIEFVSVTHVERATHHRDQAVVWMEVGFDSKSFGEEYAVNVQAGSFVISSDAGPHHPTRRAIPFQIAWRQPYRFQGLSKRH